MTRWARGNPITQKKPHQPTPWSQMTNTKKDGRKLLPNKVHNEKKQSVVVPPVELKAAHKRKKEPAELRRDEIVSTGLAAELEKSNPIPAKKYNAKASSTHNKTVGRVSTKRSGDDIEVVTELKHLKHSTPDLTPADQIEIGRQIKKEARREKRRLQRVDGRKMSKMCFNCRKEGHDVSECPSLKQDNDQGTGICFKCGSAEHSVHRCRLKLPPGEYPYAKCFICSEMGHLSNQCPDNPRGLYPSGGCCLRCGSVEHYKKDCPETQKELGINDITLTTFAGGSMDDEISFHESSGSFRPQKKKPKVVKF